MAIFFMVVNAQSLAQRGAGLNMGAHQLIVQNADELELSEEQKIEIIQITLDARQQVRGTRTSRGQRGTIRGSGSYGQRNGIQGRNLQRTGRGFEQMQSTHNAVMNVLREDQREMLNGLITRRAENAHEFRTLRHQVMVANAGIEGEKAEQVITILNRQSELRLNMVTMQPDVSTIELRERRAEVQLLHDELRNLLTIAEYQKLTGIRSYQRMGATELQRRPRRGYR